MEMNETTCLKDILEEVLEVLAEIYSMGLSSVNKNTLRELEKCCTLCRERGLLFAATSLHKVSTSLSLSMDRLERDYSREAEEVLLLTGWLQVCKKELELQEAKESLTGRKP